MADIENDLQDFNQFAREHANGSGNASIDELFDQWRIANPTAEDLLAIKASLRDMENGETGRLFDEFAADFEKRNNLTKEQ